MCVCKAYFTLRFRSLVEELLRIASRQRGGGNLECDISPLLVRAGTGAQTLLTWQVRAQFPKSYKRHALCFPAYELPVHYHSAPQKVDAAHIACSMARVRVVSTIAHSATQPHRVPPSSSRVYCLALYSKRVAKLRKRIDITSITQRLLQEPCVRRVFIKLLTFWSRLDIQ